MANTLFLYLEGPLQSWGERARWSIRDTASEPTKSGIVGLLGCALGLSADDELRTLSRNLSVGVRCDRPGVYMRDYHTVIGGVMSAEGKIKINANTHKPETIVSERFYLADAAFLIAVQTTHENISTLAQAVQHPVWPFFLGRKSCPPSHPVFAGVGDYATLENALKDRPVLLSAESSTSARLRAVIECQATDQDAVRRRDEIDSRSRRTFLPRYVREQMLEDVPFQEEES